MKVLITGGAGFIGSYTANLIVEQGHEVRVADAMVAQVHGGRKPGYLDKSIEIVKCDVSRYDSWKKLLSGVEAVYHLAAYTGLAQSMHEPQLYYRNTQSAISFYQFLLDNPATRKRLKKIVVASSKTIYGEGAYRCGKDGIVYPGLRGKGQLESRRWEPACPVCGEDVKPAPISEDKPPQNLSVYALTKYDTERLALMYGYAFGIRTIALRYFSAYGPRQSLENPYSGVCSIFYSRLRNGKAPMIFEDGRQLRDFIFVEDVARANLLALERGVATDVYNVGSGKGTSIAEIAGMLGDLTGIGIQPEITGRFRIGDTRSDFADISKIRKALGFVPKTGIKKGMASFVEWAGSQAAVDHFDRAEQERAKALGI